MPAAPPPLRLRLLLHLLRLRLRHRHQLRPLHLLTCRPRPLFSLDVLLGMAMLGTSNALRPYPLRPHRPRLLQ